MEMDVNSLAMLAKNGDEKAFSVLLQRVFFTSLSADVESGGTNLPDSAKAADFLWKAWLDSHSFKSWSDAKDELGCIYKGPGSAACQPAVLSFPEVLGVDSCNHL